MIECLRRRGIRLKVLAGAGGKTWRAYLSTQAVDGATSLNARDRIGRGPWQNFKGKVVAKSDDDLHSDNNKVSLETALTERSTIAAGRKTPGRRPASGFEDFGMTNGRGGSNMKRLAIAAAVIALAAGPVLAQSPPEGTPTRIAGTVDKLEGQTLTVARPDGQKQSVALTPDAKIFGVEKRKLTDIKPGDFVASGGVRGTDGKIHAVEVRIFPEALRGIGEGQRAWDARPEGVMTNATVGTVSQTGDGGIIRVTYKDGQSEFTIGPDVPVLAYVAGDTTLLKPGAAILTTARKQADGSLVTNRVTAEKDGVKPPM